uniref:Folate-biopterin transporter 3 n=1 Tax=Salix viminalis TaxID=40686 RepID=A0A6N2M6H7_SALVM
MEESQLERDPRNGFLALVLRPIHWLKMLGEELHWSFVLGVMIVYGVSQGFAVGMSKVSTKYYMKDEQKVQPSELQVYLGLLQLPWVMKPLWGLLTDTLPVLGYRRRPYFIFAEHDIMRTDKSSCSISEFIPPLISGFLSVTSMLALSLQRNLSLAFALLSLMGISAGIAIADVAIDACVTQNSIRHPSLAADMQSLCGFSSSIGALVGYSLSGFLVHLVGPKITVHVKCLLSCVVKGHVLLLVSLNIHEGMFYWYTDAKGGPSFSQSVPRRLLGPYFRWVQLAPLLGSLSTKTWLKDHPFRDLLFWSQLLYGASGLLDLILVLRLNLKIGLPDYFFVVIDEAVSMMIGRIKWQPLLVLSSKLCPAGIEGTFFALLMSIDHVGMLSSTWVGGLLLKFLKVTRTEFDNLWMAILIRSLMRIIPVFLLFLIPRSDPNLSILPEEMLKMKKGEDRLESENTEMVSLVDST